MKKKSGRVAGNVSAGAGDCQSEAMELGRSMLRFSWAMTVFGAQQATSLVAASGPGTTRSKPAEAFDAIAGALEGQFGGVFRGAYATGKGWLDAREEPGAAGRKG